MYSKTYSTTRRMRTSKLEKHAEENNDSFDDLVDKVIDAFDENVPEIDENEPELRLRPPFNYEELIKLALVQSNGVQEMFEEEIIAEIDEMFPYYRNMKEFENFRKLHNDFIDKELEHSFEQTDQSEGQIKWRVRKKQAFFSYSCLARISIFFSRKSLTFYQVLEHIHDKFLWFDFSKDECWVDGVQKALNEKKYFKKSKLHCGKGNFHKQVWDLYHYWSFQTLQCLDIESFQEYETFECRGLLTLPEYVDLVNGGIYLKTEKDKFGKTQIKEVQDGQQIRYIRRSCLFSGPDKRTKYHGIGRRCLKCSKFLSKFPKKTEAVPPSIYESEVNLQRIVVATDSPVVVAGRTTEDLAQFRDDLAGLVTNTSSPYFRDTVQRVLDEEEIIQNRQAGGVVKIKMVHGY